MIEKYFVDTNVFVYARDKSAKKKQSIAHEIIVTLWKDRAGRISTQVINEVFVIFSQKFEVLLDLIESEIRSPLLWDPIPLDGDIIRHAITVKKHYNIS